MEIFLIRHTQPNVEKGICYGQTDLDVAPSFSNEVEQIKARVQEFNFNGFQIFSSPLKRCSKLASLLFPDIFKIDKRLMELNFGKWEMKNWNTIPKIESDYWFNDWVSQRTPMGESYDDLYGRCISFWEEAISKDFEKVLVVSHAGFIRASFAFFNHKTLIDSFNLKVEYGEIIKLNT